MPKFRNSPLAGNPIPVPFCPISDAPSTTGVAATERAKEEKHYMLYFIWVASYVFVRVWRIRQRAQCGIFFLASSCLPDDVSSALFRACVAETSSLSSWLAWSLGISRKRTFSSTPTSAIQSTNRPNGGDSQGRRRCHRRPSVGSQKKEYYILLNSA